MAQINSINELEAERNNGTDRILILTPIKGKEVTNTAGDVDKRLFTGDNNLHVIYENGQLWRFKFDRGDIPGALKQQFTSFTMALKTARDYYAKRNVSVEPK